jgi:tRNA-modifying protein YgfZ
MIRLGYIHFPLAIVLRVTGRDAPRYMNARLSNDVKNLPIQGVCFGAALTPQGRSQGYFLIIREAQEQFLLVCDGGNRDEVVVAFKKYIVADRVEVEDLSEMLNLFHLVGTSPAELEPKKLIRRNRGFGEGMDILLSLEMAEEELRRLESLAYEPIPHSEYEFARISAGVLSFPEELNESVLFSESGLKNAVSFKKGCYVGQEVVEKIDARGQLPRRIVRLSFPGIPILSKGERVIYGTETVGKILSSASNPSGDQTVAFASVETEVPPDSEVMVGDQVAILSELPS